MPCLASGDVLCWILGKSCGGLKFKFVARGEGEETVFGVCQVVDFGQSPIVSGIYHHVHVNHGYIIEKRIGALQKLLKENQNISSRFSTRYIAIKLLENDPDAEKLVRGQPHWKSVLEKRDKLTSQIEQLKHEDSETAITDAKYAFISGALKESYTENIKKKKS